VKEQQKQTILDLPKVIAIGISSPVATVLTSRFGVAGTLMGLALSAVILTALADILKVYLARAPATVAKIPGGFPSRFSWRNIRSRSSAAFFRFSALPPARRRSILISTVTAAGISFFVGLSVVTGLEAGVGKSLFLLGVEQLSYRVFYRREYSVNNEYTAVGSWRWPKRA